jgi:hypothetical protein
MAHRGHRRRQSAGRTQGWLVACKARAHHASCPGKDPLTGARGSTAQVREDSCDETEYESHNGSYPAQSLGADRCLVLLLRLNDLRALGHGPEEDRRKPTGLDGGDSANDQCCDGQSNKNHRPPTGA